MAHEPESHRRIPRRMSLRFTSRIGEYAAVALEAPAPDPALRHSGAHRGGALFACSPSRRFSPSRFSPWTAIRARRWTRTGGRSSTRAMDPDFLPTQAKLLTSREIAERVVRKLNLLENPDLNPTKSGAPAAQKPDAARSTTRVLNMAHWVQGSVDVEQVKGTNLLALSCEAPDASPRCDVANAVAEAYIQWNLEAKTEMSERASQFFADQIRDLKKELEELEQQLLAYGRQKDIISVDPQTNVTLQKLESLNRDYASAVADRVSKEARYHEVETAKPEAIADTLSGGLISWLRAGQPEARARLRREAEHLQARVAGDAAAEGPDRQGQGAHRRGRQGDRRQGPRRCQERLPDGASAGGEPEGRSRLPEDRGDDAKQQRRRVQPPPDGGGRKALDARQHAQTSVGDRGHGEHRWSGGSQRARRRSRPAAAQEVSPVLSPKHRPRARRRRHAGRRARLPPLVPRPEPPHARAGRACSRSSFARRDPRGGRRRAKGYGYRRMLGKARMQEGRDASRNDRIASAHAPAFPHRGAISRSANGSASVASWRHQVDRRNLLRAAGRQDGDGRQPRGRPGAARQAGPDRGRRPPSAASARDPARSESDGARLDPGGQRRSRRGRSSRPTFRKSRSSPRGRPRRIPRAFCPRRR